MEERTLLQLAEIEEILQTLAEKIFRDIRNMERFAVVGLQTRGVELARRLRLKLEKLSGAPIQHGVLDITFHRDDLATRGVLPVIKETRIEFDISNATILLVDDVIFTGRTTKAALESLTTFGRPKSIKLFALVDRGNREMPIQPDYCGHSIATDIGDDVRVLLSEIDGVEDSVLFIKGS